VRYLFRKRSSRIDPLTTGTWFGILSALAYTGANLALRQVAQPNDPDWAVWVSCMKAVPAAAVAWGLIAYRAGRGLPALPERRTLLPLLATGLFMQIGGNVMFQWSLGLGGLALTVPLLFATLLVSSGILGRVFLDEPITRRTLAAIVTLVVSVIFLSSGTGAATRAIVAESDWTSVAGAILTASMAGLAYGVTGVVLRRYVQQTPSLSASLVLISTSGVVSLGLISLYRLGPARMLATGSADLQMMLVAGLLNAAAFFALGAAYKYIGVLRVNLLNASQAALAAACGVLWFGEPATGGLLVGTALTMLGLVMMDGRKRKDSAVGEEATGRE